MYELLKEGTLGELRKMVLSIPVLYHVRMKFSRKYVYLGVEHGWNRLIIKMDNVHAEDGSSPAAAAKLAQQLATRIRANPRIRKVHLDVKYELLKKEEEHHPKILAIAEALKSSGVRLVGYG